MTYLRDLRSWLLFGAVTVTALSGWIVQLQRSDRDWARSFDGSQLELSWAASSLQLEHHRFGTALRRFMANGDRSRHDALMQRFQIYLSRYDALITDGDLYFDRAVWADAMGPTSRPRVEGLADALLKLQGGALATLEAMEPELASLRPNDTRRIDSLQTRLDVLGDDVNAFLLSAFERVRYLNRARSLMADRLAARLRTAVSVLIASSSLLALALLAWIAHRRRSALALRLTNERLAAEIDESARLARELEQQATRDSLSALLNRRGFTDELTALLDRGVGQHGLCFVDLDHFKIVNDTCGHACGDRLIGEIAALLRANTRTDDLICRYGGDEFVVVLHDCDADAFRQRAQALCEALRNYHLIDGERRFDVSGSIGALHFEAAGAQVETLLATADAACYVAKRAGGARVHLHGHEEGLLAARNDELRWIERIREALREDRFELHRQPIRTLDAAAARPLHGYEFLVRMLDADGVLLPPARFLDVAERYSLATPIDRWVVRNVFDWCRANTDVFERLDCININLSGRSVGDAEFLAFLESLTASLPVPTGCICFELTESSLVDERARGFLDRLRALGYRIALDDFGTGFSSFGYLESLPVDYIKIDGRFVRDIDTNATHREFVRAISTVGRAMDKAVVAEFVGNAESVEVLRELGLDYAQGYHLGRPEPVPSAARVHDAPLRAARVG